METVRQQFWPEDAEVGTKLWGQATELQRTADFLAATGLRIQHGHHIERRRRRTSQAPAPTRNKTFHSSSQDSKGPNTLIQPGLRCWDPCRPDCPIQTEPLAGLVDLFTSVAESVSTTAAYGGPVPVCT